jgi:hypothetical protein
MDTGKDFVEWNKRVEFMPRNLDKNAVPEFHLR